jgi:hypothetical protein
MRQIAAWMSARTASQRDHDSHPYRDDWPLGPAEIAAEMEATVLVYGPEEAIRRVRRWTPRAMLLAILGTVARNLLTRGRQDLVQELLDSKRLLDA